MARATSIPRAILIIEGFKMRKTCALFVMVIFGTLFLVATSTYAQVRFYCSPDVPSYLGTTDYLQTQTVYYQSGSWSLEFDGPMYGIPSDVSIDAFAYDTNGDLILSFDEPVTLSGTNFMPSDLVRYDGATYTLYWSGSSAGLGPDTNIDAFALTDTGKKLISFSEPATVGGTTYMPGDVVEIGTSGLSLYLSASTLGIGGTSDISGLGYGSDNLYLTLGEPDPAATGGPYLPGDIIKYNGTSLSLWLRDSSFPGYARWDGLSFDGPPGNATKLKVQKSSTSPGSLVLSWTASTCARVTDYAIYEGTIGSWYSHSNLTCSTGGSTTADITPGSGNTYYIIVPENKIVEGSYGTNSSGNERPVGLSLCRPLQKKASC